MLFGGDSGGVVLLKKVQANFEVEILSPLLARSLGFVCMLQDVSFWLSAPASKPTAHSHDGLLSLQNHSPNKLLYKLLLIMALYHSNGKAVNTLTKLWTTGPKSPDGKCSHRTLASVGTQSAPVISPGTLHPSPLGMTVTRGMTFIFHSHQNETHT